MNKISQKIKKHKKNFIGFENVDKLSSADLKAIGKYVFILEEYGKTKIEKEVG